MMKRIFCCTLSCVFLLTLLIRPAFAKGAGGSFVFDDGALLSEDAEQELSDLAEQASERTDCDFYIATYKSNLYIDDYLGIEFLREHRLSEYSNIVLLVITKDRGTFFYDLYLYGDAERKFAQSEIDLILDDDDEVYDNIKSGDLESGIEAFLKIATAAYEGQIGGYYLKLFLISLAFALFFAFITCFSVYKAYTAKRRSVDYPLERYAKIELTEKDDVFVGSFVTSRVIRTNNGGYGGGGGSSPHGGGRGHAGGR